MNVVILTGGVGSRLSEDPDVRPVAAERFGRAAKLMASPATKRASRREFRAAARDLPVAKRVVASVAGYSGLAWHVLRAARQVKRARSDGSVRS